MESMQIFILNPKAENLLKDLEDLELIVIKKSDKKNNFIETIERIQERAKSNLPTFEEITAEVESVRTEMHASKKS